MPGHSPSPSSGCADGSVEPSKSTCMPTQTPSTGRPPLRRRPMMRGPCGGCADRPCRRGSCRRPGTKSPSHVERARAGRTVSVTVGTDALQGAHGRADVAAAVVEDDDVGAHRGAHRQSAPLALGIPTTRGSGATAARSARATALNWASTMWCGSRPASTRTWRHSPALEAKDSKHVAGHRAGEVTADEGVLLALRLALVHDVGATGDVDDRVREGLVERHRARHRSGEMPVLSPSASRSAWPSTMAVSSTVWCTSTCDVAGGLDGEVDERVLAQRVEHVVVERTPVDDVGRAGAVEVEPELDGRLGRARVIAARCGSCGWLLPVGAGGEHVRGGETGHGRRGTRSSRRGRPP